MNIFKYLKDEGKLVEHKLTELVQSLTEATREEIFDEVKLSCDNIIGYLDKQQRLLLNTLADLKSVLKNQFETHQEKMNALRNEVETLTMVHVDEPGYDKYLQNLLLKVKECNASLSEFVNQLSKVVPSDRLNKLNHELEEISHASIQFNKLPVESHLEHKPKAHAH